MSSVGTIPTIDCQQSVRQEFIKQAEKNSANVLPTDALTTSLYISPFSVFTLFDQILIFFFFTIFEGLLFLWKILLVNQMMNLPAILK